ncbi:hypothetical protein Tco_0940266 [Tanacetum coccineum]|uniref:Retrovirus-related Pol polyprotein from transposon TNT 1-94-like beta-barrel domain-containing protein n=1 Tax=Tanacetum coccineum TaxID=301880 RepID=A0ABQ5DMI2_9ASTR
MSGVIPPIPPPFRASSGNPGSPNANRVDTMPITTDPINTTTTKNVAQSVVDENLPQLLDSRGGSHVTNVPAFDKEDFTSWKVRFLVFLDGLEPYLLKTLVDGPFVPMSSLSTTENPLPKRQNQWSNVESRLANQDQRLKSIIISCLPNDVMKYVIKCKTAKEMWNDLILAHEGPSDTRDTKIAALRLKFNTFKSLKGEKVMGTFTRLKCLLHDPENNGVTIPQAEVNATFVNSLPRKWLSMNQTQRANNSIKNDNLATLYGKYNYEEGLIDQIYESETQRVLIQASSSKALISNTQFQDSDSDVEEDQRTSNEFMANLNAEYHERALLANPKRFYKRSGRVGSARKPIDKTKETCFAWKNDKGKSEKGLIAESFDWDKEYVSSEDEGTTRIRAFMAIAEDEPSVGKANARSGQWVDITMKKTCSKVTLDQLLYEQIRGNIVKDLGGKGRRKENNSSKEVLFFKANVSTSESAPMITSDSEDDSDIQEPLPPHPKLTGADPFGASKNTSSSVSQACSSKTPKQKVWYGPCKHSGMRNHLFDDCYSKPKCSTCGSISYTTKEHTEQTAVRKSLNKLKGQSTSKSTLVRTTRMSKIFGECKYYGSNKHHPDDCEFYPRCEICGSIAHEIPDCPKNLRNSRKQRDYLKRSVWYLDSGCSRHMTGVKQYLHRYSKDPGPKVVFRDDSSGDTEGYGLVNCNGITFTRVAYVNGLKHNLISISQLCDANFKLEEFYDEKGISRNFSSPCTPEQNGVAEKEIEHSLKQPELWCSTSEDEKWKKPFMLLSVKMMKLSLKPTHKYFPYVSAYENITSSIFPILQNSVTSEEPPEFTIASDLSAIHEPDHAESPDILESAESQDNVLNRWSREKHIELVNIISEPQSGIKTRSRVRDSDAASVHECLYVNFLSEIEPKKLIDTLEEEGWVIAMQDELN